MNTIPTSLEGRWAAIDGRPQGATPSGGAGKTGLILELRVVGPAAAVIDVWGWKGGPVLTRDRPACWHPRTPGEEASRSARQRLDTLVVELEEPGLGPTWDLFVGARVADTSETGGLEWGPLRPDSPVEDVRLFSQVGASFYEAVLGWYDVHVKEERERHAWAQAPATFHKDLTARR